MGPFLLYCYQLSLYIALCLSSIGQNVIMLKYWEMDLLKFSMVHLDRDYVIWNPSRVCKPWFWFDITNVNALNSHKSRTRQVLRRHNKSMLSKGRLWIQSICAQTWKNGDLINKIYNRIKANKQTNLLFD